MADESPKSPAKSLDLRKAALERITDNHGKPKPHDMTVNALMHRNYAKMQQLAGDAHVANRTIRSTTELGIRTSGYGIKAFPKKVIEVVKKKKERPNPYSNVRLNPYNMK